MREIHAKGVIFTHSPPPIRNDFCDFLGFSAKNHAGIAHAKDTIE